jgi:serine acetyltransferase
VLKSVPARCTAAGVPARLVGMCANQEPARDMDQSFGQDTKVDSKIP